MGMYWKNYPLVNLPHRFVQTAHFGRRSQWSMLPQITLVRYMSIKNIPVTSYNRVNLKFLGNVVLNLCLVQKSPIKFYSGHFCQIKLETMFFLNERPIRGHGVTTYVRHICFRSHAHYELSKTSTSYTAKIKQCSSIVYKYIVYLRSQQLKLLVSRPWPQNNIIFGYALSRPF